MGRLPLDPPPGAGKTGRPTLLDNRGEGDHGTGLATLAADPPRDAPVSVATGYVNLGGLATLAAVTGPPVKSVRLLIGVAPPPGGGSPRKVRQFFAEADEDLRRERNFGRFPPSRAQRRIGPVAKWLQRPEVEVRRYRGSFLHGKAYLFGDDADPRAALVSSANLTAAGMQKNLELGLVEYGPDTVRKALHWFDRLWESPDAEDFRDDLEELLGADPVLDALEDPQTIYLRILLEYFGVEFEQEPPRPQAVRLAEFQWHGFRRALRIVERCGGVLYADGVGTGKTEIGLAFLEKYAAKEGKHALVVAPAQLVDTWQRRIHEANLPGKVVSFHQLAGDRQLNPDSDNRTLPADKDAYRLIVVDEAHAFRNPDTGWHRALSRLLGGEEKHAVFLTATPINNGLPDLFHLVMAFARHDGAFAAHGIRSLRGLFKSAGALSRDGENLDPDRLFPLADLVSVRRDRAFIEKHYPDAAFPDGTPLRFPEPELATVRYGIDAVWPGLVTEITAAVEELTLARYRPDAWRKAGGGDGGTTGEAARNDSGLTGLLRSAILKRFESCHESCRLTVERMEKAHGVFLEAWEAGFVPDSEALSAAAREELDETGAAAWLREETEDEARRPIAEFDPELRAEVAADRERLRAIRERLEAIREADDPKLATLVRLLEESPSRKVVVFSAFADTVRYLDEHLDEVVAGRRRAVVIGEETTPDERMRELERFAPESVVGPAHRLPEGVAEVDLLLSNDVLSEGQNLQQAAAVVSYDFPWNPQRVVQRYGRVIRLKSPHDRVFLTTMLPAAGDLEPILKLEQRIRAKIEAARLYGMDVGVVGEGEAGAGADLESFAERLAAGDPSLLRETVGGGLGEAFGGESLRAEFHRRLQEGELKRLRNLPWGVGAAFPLPPPGVFGSRARSGEPSPERTPGVFFACRTTGDDRYWRFVPLEETKTTGPEPDALQLRRIAPGNAAGLRRLPPEVDLEGAWKRAAESIVAEHGRLAAESKEEVAIGPRQRWAIGVLRSADSKRAGPEVDRAVEALRVGRSQQIRRDLGRIEKELEEKAISTSRAAERILEIVASEGLRPVPLPKPLEPITGEEDLGVVCWMALLPPTDA